MIKDFLGKIKETIKIFLKHAPFGLSFENIGYVPRWLVLWFDIQVAAIALILAGLIINDFSLSFFNILFVPKILLALLVTLVSFIILKTYVGLIRHSSYMDVVKLFFASSFSVIVLFIINIINFKIWDKYIYSLTFLILYALGLFVGLFLFRAIVKQIYSEFLAKNQGDSEKVFVLGTSQNAISIAVAIENEFPKRFKIIGFLDSEIKNGDKRIFGVPILYLKRKAHVLIRAHNGVGIIILENDLKDEENLQHIEDCIEHNIKVYRAPSISEIDLNGGINKSIQNIQIEDLLERKPIKIDNDKILDLIENKTVFVTGGAGSIGSEIVCQIGRYKPKTLIVIDQAETPLHDLALKVESQFKELDFHPVIRDIRNKESLEFLFETFRPNLIYHCAAYKHVPMMEKNPSEAVSVNILGTKILADLALKYKVERFIMVSTDKAVNPSNVMGATKRVAEMYVQSMYNFFVRKEEFTTKFITTRFGNVLGSNGSVVPLFKRQIEEGGPITVTHSKIIRYFMTIPEACQLVMEAGCMGKGGEIFIFDMGKAVKIIDLANKMIRLAGFIPGRDIKIKEIGLRPGEKLYEELLNDKSIALPTYHEKILIVKENNDMFEYVSAKVENIKESMRENKHDKIVQMIKELVPEYKSLNSKFAKFDKQ